MEFSFLHPQYMYLLFLVPLLFFIHFLALGNKKKKALKFANFDAISKIQGVDFFSKNLVILFMNIIVIVLVIFAVSGLTYHTTKESSSFSYVIAIDSSQSMEANDLPPNRISAAKEVASSFVDSLPVDVKLGVISFSGGSKIEIDISGRKDEIRNAIDGIEISGYGGTDLYEAILTSTNILKKESFKSIIVLSDGQVNVGNIDDAIDYANDNNVVVNTIGIGTLEGGETEYGFSRIDEDSLRSVAYLTKGSYFNSQNKENLSNAFIEIFKLTKRKVSIALADNLLLLAIAIIVLEFFLSNTRYINLP